MSGVLSVRLLLSHSLVTARLWNVYPQHGLWSIGHPMQSVHQMAQIVIQMFSVIFLGNIVDARGCITAQFLKTSQQQLFIHQVIQTGELKLRLFASFLCYAFQFRFYTFFASVHDMYFLLTQFLDVTAFPPAALPAFFGTTPSSDSLHRNLPSSLFIACQAYSL